MSRRTLSSAALAAVLLTSGLTPLLGTAHADNCVTWTDPADDTSAAGLPPNGLGTNGPANLDITRVSVQTVGESVVATLRLKDLDETGYSYAGDQFQVQMTLAGTAVSFLVRRGPAGTAAQVKGPATGAATSSVDTNAILIAATQAELDKAAGKPTKGIEAKSLAGATYAQVNNNEFAGFDTAQAPSGTVFTVGAQCSPAVLPPLPLKFPAAGCKTLSDNPGDAIAKPSGETTVGGNEPALDITGLALNTTPTAIIAFVQVPGLAAKAPYNGDEFRVGFAFKRTFSEGPPLYIEFTARRANTAVRGESAPVVATSSEATVAVSAKYDIAKKFVIFTIDRRSLEETSVHKTFATPVNGVTAVNLRAMSYGFVAGSPVFPIAHDVVADGEEAKRTYTIGESPCFEPTVSKLTNLGATTTQFGDVLDVSAKLTSSSDQPFANKAVKFTLGSVSTTATTDAEGVATGKITPTATAGTHNLVISFAGDQDTKASTATRQVTVAPEVTNLTLTVKKSGTKRTVTAKLVEDDGKALAGQVVTWFVNGKRISAPKTNSGGIVTISTAKAGQTVKAVFAGVADKYAGSDAQEKLT